MKILFLSPWFPTPPINGSKIRIYHLLRALATQHKVSLVSFIRPGEAIDIPATQEMAVDVKTVPFREFQPHTWRARLAYLSPRPRSVVDTFSPDMACLVSNLAPAVDRIIASESVMAPYVPPEISFTCILDDLELVAARDAFCDGSNWVRFRRWLAWKKNTRYVRQLLQRFHTVTVVSDVEKAVLMQIAPDFSDLRVLPNGVDTLYHNLGSAIPQPGSLVYSGALTYSANLDAVTYFLEEIFPLIRQAQPQARLQITGSTQGVDISALRIDEQVHFTGFVDDIRPVVSASWVCVVPLRKGSGTRLKILEAMALGTPVVSTRKGAEGLAVTSEYDILIADSPVEFARQVVRLLEDVDLRNQLVANGRALVEQRYSWGQIGQDFCTLVEEIAI